MRKFPSLSLAAACLALSTQALAISPTGIETITPTDRTSFDANCNTGSPRAATPNARMQQGDLLWDAAIGDPQSDPQLAVGGGFVFVATNSANLIYDKTGGLSIGLSPGCFSSAGFPIDPKVYFDPQKQRFGMGRLDLTQPYNVRIAISKTADPRQGWWLFKIPTPDAVDGGAIGYSDRFIVYVYPTGAGKRLLVLDAAAALQGQVTKMARFSQGNFDTGQPVFTQDAATSELYLLGTSGNSFTVSAIRGDIAAPTLELVATVRHDESFGFPPRAVQQGSGNRPAAGDANTKLAVLQNASLWFANSVTSSLGGKQHSAIRWGQLSLKGEVKQLGAIDDASGNVFEMQPTIGVNKNGDVLLGYQESSATSYVSACYAYRLAADAPNTLRPAVLVQAGSGAAPDGAWGDYSGTGVDGDNQLDIWTIQSHAAQKGGGIHQTVVVRHSFEGVLGGGGAGGAAAGSGGGGSAGGAVGGAAGASSTATAGAGLGGLSGVAGELATGGVGGTATPSGGTSAGSANPTRPGGAATDPAGCGCRMSPGTSLDWLALVGALGLAFARRRHPQHRSH